MRAVEISKYGPPDVLRVVDRPQPVVREGEVLIRVAAAGVSHADVMQRQGSYPPPKGASDIPGLECAGTLADTGDPVCALLTGGGYAEYVAVPWVQVLPVPQGWTMVEAACLPENMFTVYDNLITRARFQRGESLLVHGGTSGIGSTAIMMAKAFGASMVIATAGSAEKCAAAKSFGADAAINYNEEDFVARVNDLTNGRGVDAIVDIVGGQYIARDLQCIAPDGRIVSLATGGGNEPTIDLRLVLQRRAAIMGSSLRARPPELKAPIAQALLKNVWPLLPAKTTIKPLVDSTFPLEKAAEAHKRMEASSHIGKIVLEV
ncbi:MAG TPA: NAD(P)H-quinone oxidoreductase [Candidatus Baltobacteraceae bacterium]|nr:NAD(P)H-quinone oxidoreductase [Candidatus Baltobacteraceae bacterium]